MEQLKQRLVAIKWCDKFRDCDINYIELLDHWMG